MKKLLYIALLSAFSFGSFAGNSDKDKMMTKTVSGRITDVYGESIPGAKITIPETGETFFADMDGNFYFTMKADKEYAISVNTIGFRPLEIKSTHLTAFTDLSLKPLN